MLMMVEKDDFRIMRKVYRYVNDKEFLNQYVKAQHFYFKTAVKNLFFEMCAYQRNQLVDSTPEKLIAFESDRDFQMRKQRILQKVKYRLRGHNTQMRNRPRLVFDVKHSDPNDGKFIPPTEEVAE